MHGMGQHLKQDNFCRSGSHCHRLWWYSKHWVRAAAKRDREGPCKYACVLHLHDCLGGAAEGCDRVAHSPCRIAHGGCHYLQHKILACTSAPLSSKIQSAAAGGSPRLAKKQIWSLMKKVRALTLQNITHGNPLKTLLQPRIKQPIRLFDGSSTL
jgi:hypothetical protein